MNYTDVSWIRQNHTKIHLFGLGFIQVKLNVDERMHFYHPNFQREREEIHNHRYDFHSTIIKGMLMQEIFSFNPYSSEKTHELYETDCGPNHEGEPGALLEGTIKLEYATILTIGSEYTMPHLTFHRVGAKRCVTLLRRGVKVKDAAQVVREKGYPVACPFAESQPPEDTLWQMVEDCLYG